MNFFERAVQKIKKKQSYMMLGLDPKIENFPIGIEKTPEGAYEFCAQIMKATAPYIIGIKIQMAYFEVWGSTGIEQVEKLLELARELELLTMIDGKRGDIGSTATAYANAYLEPNNPLSADSCTINPLMGSESVTPFLMSSKANKNAAFVLLHTSNPSSSEIISQANVQEEIGKMLLKNNAQNVLGAVVGATQKDALKQLRERYPQTWFLCPGVGAQGASVSDVLSNAGQKVLIPVSRAVLYASTKKDFAEKAKQKMAEYQSQCTIFETY